MVTKVVALTTGTTWTVPSDFSSLTSVECIGAGGNGGVGSSSNGDGSGGGGGGAYAKIISATLVAGTSYTIQIGTGGGTTIAATSSNIGGTGNSGIKDGTGNWVVAANGGSTNTGTTTGAAGGTTGNSIGSTLFAGGSGGNSGSSEGGGGGGGAAGSSGAGGTATNASTSSGTAGGAGDNSTGGSGGALGTGSSSGNAGAGTGGGAGTEWTYTSLNGTISSGTIGTGGGGGGGGSYTGTNNSFSAGTGGNGGNYGAGGGGGGYARSTQANGGNGTQGFIVVTYIASIPDVPVFPTQKFSQTQFPNKAIVNRLYYHREETDTSQKETNPHFIGRFAPSKVPPPAIVSTFFLWNPVYVTPPVGPTTGYAEPHFLGRFTDTSYWKQVLKTSPLHDIGEVPAPQGGASSILVNVYDYNFISPVLSARIYYQQPAHDDQYQDFTQSFLGRFRATIHARLPVLTQGRAGDSASETNISFIGRFTAGTRHATLPLLRQNTDHDVAPFSTNVSFLGRHTPLRYTILPLLRHTRGINDVNPETNVHFIGRHTPTVFKRFNYNTSHEDPAPLKAGSSGITVVGYVTQWPPAAIRARYLQQQAVDGPNVIIAETNVNVLGKFVPLKHAILPGLRQHSDEVSTSSIVVETNPHFIGRFTSPKLARFNYQEPATEAATAPVNFDQNVTFLGIFDPGSYAILGSLRGGTSDGPPVAETNVSFIGKFVPDTYRRFNYNATDNQTFAGTQQGGATSMLVVLYDNQYVSPAITPRLYYWGQAKDFITTAPTAEAASSFRGRFTIPYISRQQIAALYHAPSDDVPRVETNVSFIGRFRQTVYPRLASLAATTGDGVQPETNPHFIGRFRPTSHAISPVLRLEGLGDFPLAESGANPHFIGRYTIPTITISPIFRNLTPEDTSSTPTVQPDASVTVIARYSPTVFKTLAALRQNSPFDQVIPDTPPSFFGRYTGTVHARLQTDIGDINDAIIPDVPPSFLGRFQPTMHTVPSFLRQNPPEEPAFVVVPETNVSFLGRFKQIAHQRFNYNPMTDVAVAAKETNPHFLGRFTQSTIRISPELRMASALDLDVETNVSFLGRYAPLQHRLLPTLRQHGDVLSPSAVVTDTYVSFLGRYKITVYARISFAGEGVDGVVKETNPHFVGRHQPARFSRLALSSFDTSVVTVAEPNPPRSHARFTNPQFFINPRLRQNSATDFGFLAPVIETNVSFLGRFVSPTFQRFAYNFTPQDFNPFVCATVSVTTGAVNTTITTGSVTTNVTTFCYHLP
jgi:hypothetical protein